MIQFPRLSDLNRHPDASLRKTASSAAPSAFADLPASGASAPIRSAALSPHRREAPSANSRQSPGEQRPAKTKRKWNRRPPPGPRAAGAPPPTTGPEPAPMRSRICSAAHSIPPFYTHHTNKPRALCQKKEPPQRPSTFPIQGEPMRVTGKKKKRRFSQPPPSKGVFILSIS